MTVGMGPMGLVLIASITESIVSCFEYCNCQELKDYRNKSPKAGKQPFLRDKRGMPVTLRRLCKQTNVIHDM